MKKFLSILLAAMMLLATAGVAFAAENVAVDTTTTVVNLSTHTFKAYQIFGGTQADDSDGALGDIVWGDGVDSDMLVTKLKEKFTSWAWPETEITAQVVADLLYANSSDAKEFAHIADECISGAYVDIAGSATEVELAAGYYLIVDTTPVNGALEAVANASLLQVTGDGDIEIKVKTDKPTQSKKVQENVKEVPDNMNMTGADGENNYNDVADYSIGDKVPYTIYSAVPDMSYFKTYTMKFTDKMSKGLTYNDDMVVTVGGVEFAATVTKTTDADQNTIIEVTLSDLKAFCTDNEIDPGAEILLGFSAKLDEDAVIGLPGNPNESKLSYSNNPDDETSFGETPWDEVLVFTYELDVTKVDGKDNTKTLEGAEFVLRNSAGKYAKIDANKKVTGWAETQEEATPIVSDENGLFSVIGLDDGAYELIETVAPKGYNLLPTPVPVVIAGETNHGEEYLGTPSNALKTLKITVDGEEADGDTTSGIVEATVENNVGAVLPETGGIGTTLFYLFGSIMAAGSALILVVRRRAEAEEE